MSYIQKPPTAGESGPIDVPALFDAIELPQQYHTAHFIRQHIVPAIASEFADGEITILHPPETEPAIREFFGDHEYSKGSFGRRFREITEGEDQSLRHHADSFIRFCANIVAKDVLEGGILPPPDPNVMVRKAGRAVLFDQKIVALNTDPRFVVDYGPGLQGRFHIEEQYATIRNTYQYAAFTKGPFVNEFLMGYWGHMIGHDLLPRLLGGLYAGRENGLADASGDLISELATMGKTDGIADVVVASGIHSAGERDVETGIRNAHTLLRDGGSLVIRAPKKGNNASSGYAYAEGMLEMAESAGFSIEDSKLFAVQTGGEATKIVDAISAVVVKT